MTRAHGANRYVNGPNENGQEGEGCRCGRCRKAANRSRNIHRMAVIRGDARPRADAEPVRIHVLALDEAGMTRLAIARAAGTTHSVLSRLVGTPQTRRVKTIRAVTAEAILAVRPGMGTDLLVRGVGTQRRLRGLACQGWPNRIIAEHSGLAHHTVWRFMHSDANLRVTASAESQVMAAARQLHGVDPAVKGVDSKRVAAARKRALDADWVPLAAWDDIDDPDAVPDLGEPIDQGLALLEDSDWLIAQGYTIERAAERMGLPASTLGATRLRTKAKLAAPPGPKKKITRNRVPKKALHLLSESERLRAEGLSIPAVAAEFGISEGYLKRARALALRHLEGAS